MNLSDLGELGLIARLRSRLMSDCFEVVQGLGDDAAVLRWREDRLLLFTTDLLVEGQHFQLDWTTPEDLGWKALAVNVSDIGAMGGQPTFAVVSLGAPADTPVRLVDGLYEGLLGSGETYGVTIVGGDVVRSERLVLNLALLGEVAPSALTLRSGAQPGEVLLVTGTLGDAAAGLYLLQHGAEEVPPPAAEAVRRTHHRPTPPLAAAQAIARTGKVTAMIDVSDGLAGDLGHLCTESQVGARVKAAQIPLSPVCRTVAKAVGQDPLAWALHGGEDYQLLFTCPGEAVAEIRAAAEAVGVEVAVIGRITPSAEGVRLVEEDGREQPLEAGFDHFA